MENISVAKDDLLNTLRENRDAHRAQYEEAAQGYRASVIEELEKRLAKVRDGGKVDLNFRLPEPQSYVDEYDTAIGMLKWEQRDQVELSQYDFKKYVLNQWDWSSVFTASTSRYTTS